MGEVVSQEQLLEKLLPYRDKARIVTTNGCFDIFHVGHLRYLRAARALGDLLVVLVNSDHSVQILKGPHRPIVPELERAELLAGLACVDFVVIFDEPTPMTLLQQIRPSIHVKGGQYSIDTLPESEGLSDMGAQMVFIPMVEGRSTTQMIEKIQGLPSV